MMKTKLEQGEKKNNLFYERCIRVVFIRDKQHPSIHIFTCCYLAINHIFMKFTFYRMLLFGISFFFFFL